MACCHFYPAVNVEMEQRKVQKRRGTNTNVVNMQPSRCQPRNDRFRVRIGGRAAISPYRDSLAALVADNSSVHFSQQQSKLLIKILLRQPTNVILAKNSRVHSLLRLLFCNASRAASRIAFFILVSSA